MPIALLALTAGAFGIGTTEFVIMGLLLQVSADLHVSIATAGLCLLLATVLQYQGWRRRRA